MITMIPLNQLTRSDLNVRKTEKSAEIPSLADDIAARGLKQNLVAVPTGVDAYEVVAGGRRFQALTLLVERGVLAADWPVPVLIDAPGEATETSLAENLSQVAMNPADEFLAFSTIIAERAEGDEAERIAYCARRFGKTETYVVGRLRLSALSETVLEGLRTNVIGLTAATAYASVADHALQDKVFAEQLKSNWKPHDPQIVRDALRAKTYSPDDGKVKFATLKAYTAAGGRTDIDMFTLDATERLLDPSIIDKLVKDKVVKELPKFAKKIGAEGAVICPGHHNAPAAVKGWSQVHDYAGDKVKARLEAKEPTQVAVYIDETGKFKIGTTFLIPVDPDAPVVEPTRYVQETDEQRAERARAQGIILQAFHLAFPRCAGTVVENRIFMPKVGSWARIENDGEDVYLEVKARITKAELEAQMDAAAPLYDARVAEIAAAKAESAAAAEAIKADLIANPPAVIVTGAWGGTVWFRWADGTYADAAEDDEDASPDHGADNVAEVLEHHTARNSWATIEDYRADQLAEDDAEDADAEA